MESTHPPITIPERLATKDWPVIRGELHDKGFVLVKGLLNQEECERLIAGYKENDPFRKTIHMERYRFGSGEYKYFQYPLPDLITELREGIYPAIVPVANQWMEEGGIDQRFPPTHPEMKSLCHRAGQTQPTVLLLKYGPGGFNTLHQDLYGAVWFPLQMVLMLNQVNKDYTGGEFVLTEQIPRAQSKANVLTPDRGDLLIFATNFRLAKGSRGYYRVNMKHGVSPLQDGERHSLGIIFHDALS